METVGFLESGDFEHTSVNNRAFLCCLFVYNCMVLSLMTDLWCLMVVAGQGFYV